MPAPTSRRREARPSRQGGAAAGVSVEAGTVDVGGLVSEHRSLAEAMGRKAARHSSELDDLVQVSLIALWKAATRYDPERGVAFVAYASRVISGEIKRFKRDQSRLVRLPRPVHDRLLLVADSVGRLSSTLGRSPTVPEIAAAAGCSEEDVVIGLDAAYRSPTVSLDAVSDGPGAAASGALAQPEDGFAVVADRAELSRLVGHLNPRERSAVWLRFFAGLTQTEIGKRLGCSQVQVSRILAASLDKLRAVAASEGDGAAVLSA
ncbi:MAG TPA: sigma-70 family RNA polymerase sigma factor [Acidimicrobiales bacterium]|nr:sigma-70 family RNA polymerase sigma factor [Acidimicrobiales bacterium]